MKSLESTLFPVVETPIPIPHGGKFVDESEGSGYKLITNGATGDVISCMSDDYKLVTNREVIESVSPAIERYNGVLVNTQQYHGNSRTQYTYRFRNDPFEISRNDTLYPQLNIRNSYDGSWVVSILAGLYRLVCANGMVVGTVTDRKRFKHILYNSNAIDNLEDIFLETIKTLQDEIKGELEEFQTTRINPDDVVKARDIFPRRRETDIDNYLNTHQVNTYWDLLNMATWISTHLDNNRYESTVRRADSIYPMISSMVKRERASA